MKEQERADTENDQAMMLAPDEELMLEVRDGTGETLGVLFDRYHRPLYNFYSKLTGDRTLSEDLVQEVFLRILKYRQSYQPGTPFRAWIYQIARNARVDHYRKTPKHITFEPEMAPAVMPKDEAQKSQEAELLHRALMQMPEEKREILILSRFQELKYDEIARLLGCELGTVKTRIHRAIQELRQNFRHLESGRINKDRNSGVTKFVPPRRAGNEV
ncbi:MAG TPA: RNA polymerase sigma factor [Candidatus Acidoferrum sp.]|nr:RNA polymerase sigma factor [Candidatus Acidoferrum sp.]